MRDLNRGIRHNCATAVVLTALVTSAARTVKAAPDPNGLPHRQDWGTSADNDEAYMMSAAGFRPRVGDMQFALSDSGFLHASSGSDPVAFWAPVSLPGGALITTLRLQYLDTDAAVDLTANLRWYGGTITPESPPPVASVSSAGSSAVPAVSSTTLSPAHTLANDARHYVVEIVLPARGPTLQFRGVEVLWRRQLSPAPALATFRDVPALDPYFPFVEALAASGVTAGCGSGNFCPGDITTRGQMAVFLARALGIFFEP